MIKKCYPDVGFRMFVQTKDHSSIDRLSPAFLAYIGDAVYELYVRTAYLLPPRKLADYHNQVVAQVRAETQAAALHHGHCRRGGPWRRRPARHRSL